MSFSDAISSLTEPQLREIIRLRRAIPLVPVLAAGAKARQACALRHRGWMNHANTFVNAMIIAYQNNKLHNPLDLATLMSAAELYADGLLAKEDLTLEEYNLLISCIAGVATPEVILTEQNWDPEPLPKVEVIRQNFDTPQESEKKRGRRARGDDPDPDGDLVDTGIDPEIALRALLKPKKKEEVTSPKISSADAISRMMAALSKKPIMPKVAEKVRIEPGSGGGFQLVGVDTGTVFAGPFDRPAAAFVHASRNKMKLGIGI